MRKYLVDESGASAAEYALILALVAAVIIGALAALGGAINNALATVTGNINTAS
jgi:pilus assembly protein Flp/PilA